MTSSADYEDKQEKPTDSKARRPEVEPLDPSFRSRVREALGQDPGPVSLHVGSAGQTEAERQGARALTREKEIYFARDEFTPATESGQRLLAHELVHTLQQTGSAKQPGTPQTLETEADLAADAVMQGRRSEVNLAVPQGMVQRQEKGKTAAPSMAKHPEEILPAPGRGAITAAGMTIAYLYTVSPGASLVTLSLQVPEGVALVVTALTDLHEGADFRVQNAAGTKARSVVIAVTNKFPMSPKLQVTFNKGSAGYIVVFQFPAAAAKK